MRLGKITFLIIGLAFCLGSHPVDSPEINPPDGTVLLMTFDEGPGGKDWSNFQNDGSEIASVFVSAGVGGSGAYDFDGINDYFRILDSASLDTVGELSFAFWFNSDENYPTGGIIEFLGKTVGVGGYEIALLTTGKLQFWYSYSGGNLLLTVKDSWVSGTWYHVVVTHDASTDIVYVDGIQDNTDPSGTLTANNLDMYIGAENLGSARYFDGVLDEISIYNRALTAAEVKDLYERGRAK